MKRVLLLAVSLSIICMVFFTKWRYVMVVDAPDYTVHGFPLPHSIPCFHTSLCTQVFVKNALINLTVHLTFWFLVPGLAKRYVSPSVWGKRLVVAVHAVAIVLAVLTGMFFQVSERVYMWEPTFQWVEVDSGMEIFCGNSYHK